jgi:hypothetical protein
VLIDEDPTVLLGSARWVLVGAEGEHSGTGAIQPKNMVTMAFDWPPGESPAPGAPACASRKGPAAPGGVRSMAQWCTRGGLDAVRPG